MRAMRFSGRQQMEAHAPDVLEHPPPLAPGLHVPLEPLQTNSRLQRQTCNIQRAATSHCWGTAATNGQASEGYMHPRGLCPFVCFDGPTMAGCRQPRPPQEYCGACCKSCHNSRWQLTYSRSHLQLYHNRPCQQQKACRTFSTLLLCSLVIRSVTPDLRVASLACLSASCFCSCSPLAFSFSADSALCRACSSAGQQDLGVWAGACTVQVEESQVRHWKRTLLGL